MSPFAVMLVLTCRPDCDVGVSPNILSPRAEPAAIVRTYDEPAERVTCEAQSDGTWRCRKEGT